MGVGNNPQNGAKLLFLKTANKKIGPIGQGASLRPPNRQCSQVHKNEIHVGK